MEHKKMCTDRFVVPRHRSQGVADGVGVSSVRLHYEPGAKPSRGLLGSRPPRRDVHDAAVGSEAVTGPAGFHLPGEAVAGYHLAGKVVPE